LTRIAQSLSFSIAFLVDIVQAEVLSTPDNTLTFRGNSIATKSMEAYMKLIGETYLRETLTRFVNDIILSKNPNEFDLEVDPDRVGNIQNLERNQITLRLLCERIWSEIQQSHHSFPQ
jgi:RAS protein activator-like 2